MGHRVTGLVTGSKTAVEDVTQIRPELRWQGAIQPHLPLNYPQRMRVSVTAGLNQRWVARQDVRNQEHHDDDPGQRQHRQAQSPDKIAPHVRYLLACGVQLVATYKAGTGSRLTS